RPVRAWTWLPDKNPAARQLYNLFWILRQIWFHPRDSTARQSAHRHGFYLPALLKPTRWHTTTCRYRWRWRRVARVPAATADNLPIRQRSEEHTSELQ